jgi:flagellar hook-associated protein 3 FlgL
VVLKDGPGGVPKSGDTFTIAPDFRTVLASQSYTSGSAITFEGLQVTITTGSAAPAADDLFRIQTGVEYQGTSGLQAIEVGDNQTVKTNLPGSQVFTGETIDLFASVKQLVAALNGNYGGGIEQGNADTETATSQVVEAQGEIGALTNRLETTNGNLEEFRILLAKSLSDNQDTDLVQAISELQQQQLALQATAQIASMIFETSLLQFLR